MNTAAVPRLLAEAAAAQQGGNPARAQTLLLDVLKLDARNAVALNALGVIALNSGDPKRAAEWHQRAADADPDAPVLWVNLAKAWRAAGDDFEERKALDKALSIDPTTFTALVRKGELHERRGEELNAMQTWGMLVQHAPPNAPAQIVEHARAYVAARTAKLAGAMEAGLAAIRAEVGPQRRIDACIDAMMGKRRIYVNEPHGVHVPFLPADEFFEREHFPWLEAFEAHTPAIRAELEALLAEGAPGFAPYVQQAAGTPENKWTPLDGKSTWGAYWFWHYGERIADAHARCPATSKALDLVPLVDLPGRMPNVFFSLLEPGGHIPPHTGVTNLRAILHLPLIVPEGCWYRVGGDVRPWRESEAWVFDDTIEHEAMNPTESLRAVLILDVWNPHLRADERRLLAKSLEVADAAGLQARVGE